MSRANDGGPAFPVPPNEAQQADQGYWQHPTGMSLRDWFAGQALCGLLLDANMPTKSAVETAWQAADMMLAVRNEQPTE